MRRMKKMRRRPTRRPGVRRSLRVFGDTAAGLDSGGTTPTKPEPRPVPLAVPNVRACSKSPPKRINLKIKRSLLKSSSGDTPGREAVAGG